MNTYINFASMNIDQVKNWLIHIQEKYYFEKANSLTQILSRDYLVIISWFSPFFVRSSLILLLFLAILSRDYLVKSCENHEISEKLHY